MRILVDLTSVGRERDSDTLRLEKEERPNKTGSLVGNANWFGGFRGLRFAAANENRKTNGGEPSFRHGFRTWSSSFHWRHQDSLKRVELQTILIASAYIVEEEIAKGKETSSKSNRHGHGRLSHASCNERRTQKRKGTCVIQT